MKLLRAGCIISHDDQHQRHPRDPGYGEGCGYISSTKPTLIVMIITLVISLDVVAAPGFASQETSFSQPNAEVMVDLNKFEYNLRKLQNYVMTENSHRERQAEICAVMKSNAYGHGLEGLIPSMIQNNISCIAITSNKEAKIVRENDYKGRLIRIRAATREEMREAVIKFGVEELIGTLKQAAFLSEIADESKKTISVHLALNSAGMGRNGLDVSTKEGAKEAKKIVNLPGVKLVGIMTHFPGKPDIAIVKQFNKEANAIISDNKLIRDDITLHIASSLAALSLPDSHLDMIRTGRLLYGLFLPEDSHYLGVLSFRTSVASIHNFYKDSPVGYGGKTIVEKGTVLANLPVGFSDGYPLEGSQVLINGQRAKVIGGVSMNTIMVDVTHIDNINPGDEVVLFGSQGDKQITMDEIKPSPMNYFFWGMLNPIRYIREPVE